MTALANEGSGSLLCVWGMRRPLALSAAPSLSPNSPSLSPALCSAYRCCEAALPSPPGLLNYCQPLACLYCTAKKATPQRQTEREREREREAGCKDRQRERERERGRLDADGQRVCRQSNIVRSEGKRKGRKGWGWIDVDPQPPLIECGKAYVENVFGLCFSV